MKRYIRVNAGPALGGKGVKVVLREILSNIMDPVKCITVSFADYKRMEKKGQIETPAFAGTPKMKPSKPYNL